MQLKISHVLLLVLCVFQFVATKHKRRSRIRNSRNKKAVNLMTCPAGQSLVPKTGHTPSHNGCGPEGSKVLVKILGVIAKEMQECCKTHDICYETCDPSSQGKCDDEFHTCMKGQCQTIHANSKIRRGLCNVKAKLMHKAVSSGGKNAFNTAQNKACMCA